MPKSKRQSKRTDPEVQRDLLRVIIEVLPSQELRDLLELGGKLLDKCTPRLEQLPEAQLADLEACARQHGFSEIAAQIFEERRRRHAQGLSPAS